MFNRLFGIYCLFFSQYLCGIALNGQKTYDVNVLYSKHRGMWSPALQLTVSNQSDVFICALSFRVPEIVLIDERCGQQIDGCKPYCKDTLFRGAYCDPLCEKHTLQDLQLICGTNTKRYTKSNITNVEKERWTFTLSNYRDLIGDRVQDRLHFGNQTNDGLLIKNASIVSGLSLDSRLLISPFYDAPGGIMGLGLTNQTETHWVHRAFLDSLIAAPIVGLSLPASVITIGGINTKNCDQMAMPFIKSELNGWILETDSFEFGTVEWGKQKIAFEPHYNSLVVPANVFSRLRNQNILIYIGATYWMAHNCSSTMNLTFSVNGHEFTIEPGYFGDVTSEDDICYFLDLLEETPLYTGTVGWVFGAPFFLKYCMALDFEKRMFTFSKAKNESFS